MFIKPAKYFIGKIKSNESSIILRLSGSIVDEIDRSIESGQTCPFIIRTYYNLRKETVYLLKAFLKNKGYKVKVKRCKSNGRDGSQDWEVQVIV